MFLSKKKSLLDFICKRRQTAPQWCKGNSPLIVCLHLFALYVNKKVKTCSTYSLLVHTWSVAGGDYSHSSMFLGCLELSLETMFSIFLLVPQLIWANEIQAMLAEVWFERNQKGIKECSMTNNLDGWIILKLLVGMLPLGAPYPSLLKTFLSKTYV